MSLLRNVLRKNTATNPDGAPTAGLSDTSKQSLHSLKTLKNSSIFSDARSVKSSGGATVYSVRSIAESITSFTSAVLGGKRVPKRRRPDVSRLGVPKWYDRNPLPAPEMPGTETAPELEQRRYTVGHAYPQRRKNAKGEEQKEPYASVVLFSHAPSTARFARYYDNGRVTGELRLQLQGPDSIESIDIWCLASTESSLAVLDGHHIQQHTNLYHRKTSSDIGALLVGNVYVFPFQFEPLPTDIKVTRPDSMVVTRVPLPPSYSFRNVGSFSGEVKYYLGVNVRREGRMTVEEVWDVPFQYYPMRRTLFKEPTMFPFIPDREDWPYSREEIGGWTVTPFGGRGRFRGEMVEIEGLLGIQAPEVYTAGQTIHYSLLLWSKSIPALEALTNPVEADIDVVFASCDIFGKDVLQPHMNTARKNRITKRLAQGRVWCRDDGPPQGNEMPALRAGPKVGKPSGERPTSVITSAEKKAAPVRRSRMKEVFKASDQIDSAEGEDEDETEDNEQLRTPSPVEDPPKNVEDAEHLEGTVRLDGDLLVPSGLHPSFRYRWMGREYVLHVIFTHPDYSHITPSAISIYAETPIWIVLGKPIGSPQDRIQASAELNASVDYLSTLAIVGDTISVPKDAIKTPICHGGSTTKGRPLIEGPRYGL